VKTISERDLRERTAEVLRAVTQGETFEVTKRRRGVAQVVPPGEVRELRAIRPATARPAWSRLARPRVQESSCDALDGLRDERQAQ
jgi:prevent-host-death family protein